jgi:putative flavoprotein involved in K+ transport
MENVVVIGAGQAGLAVSFFLKRAEVRHVVLERGEIGETWRSQRWDSFRFNTPNAATVMPGCAYAGSEPDGFMTQAAFVDLLERFAARHQLPVVVGANVTSVRAPTVAGPFEVVTTKGTLVAATLVLAGGSQNCAKVPALSRSLPAELTQLHAGAYRTASRLPPGAVLVVGSGSSGGQIAEDLIDSGRTVLLSTSRVPSFPRRYRGRDIIDWFAETGRLAERLEDVGVTAARAPQPLLSGTRGGHTLNLRSLHDRGVILLGRLVAIDGDKLTFDDSVAANVRFGDDAAMSAKENIDKFIASRGLHAPNADHQWDPSEATVDQPECIGATTIDAAQMGISTVIWCTGFGADYSWIDLPIFDASGQPKHKRGITDRRGVYITGLPWLSARRSGLVVGAEDDARYIVASILSTIRA